MSCKPDITKTDEMYELYQQGFSLSEVGKAFGVSRQSIFKRFQRRELKLREKKQLPFIIYKNKKYTVRSNGYYACTNKKRHSLHRVVWEEHNDKIPDGHDIHHIDWDKTNNKIENLELYTKSEHAHLFNKYTKPQGL